MNLDLRLKRGASFLTYEIIDLRTDHRNLCYYLLRSSGARGVDLLPFYRHIAPLERKRVGEPNPYECSPPFFQFYPSAGAMQSGESLLGRLTRRETG